MPVLPLPLIVALILGFLCLRAALGRETPGVMLALLAACALHGAVISGNLYYGVRGLGAVQPITAATLPPLAWVAFVTTTRRRFEAGRDLWHAAVPLFAGFCAGFAPEALDQVVIGGFLGYGGAMVFALRAGRDGLVQTPLGSGEAPVFIWRAMAGALIVTGLSDVLILAAMATGHPHWRSAIIAVFASGGLLALAGLGLSRILGTGAEVESSGIAMSPDPETDTQIMAEVTELMAARKPFLDPDLTLQQIARRLRRPAKAVSAASNRAAGENVSRFINAHRIAHACQLLGQGQMVTQAMLGSGFNTKSNFNREFLRFMGQAPTQWLAQQEVRGKAGNIG